MNSFENFRVEIKSDASSEWITFRAERGEHAKGLRYVWFVIWRKELEAVINGKVTTLEDGYHKANVYGDVWIFYDMEIPRHDAGDMVCPYVKVEIPRTFLKAVYRLARKTWKLMAQGRATPGVDSYKLPGEVRVEIDRAHAEKIVRLYGSGKGEVELDFGGDPIASETKALFFEAMERDKGFRERVEHLKAIAQNTTRGFHQKARLVLRKEYGGRSFYWNAVNPRGHCVLNGGLIDHGSRPERMEADWSIHT